MSIDKNSAPQPHRSRWVRWALAATLTLSALGLGGVPAVASVPAADDTTTPPPDLIVPTVTPHEVPEGVFAGETVEVTVSITNDVSDVQPTGLAVLAIESDLIAFAEVIDGEATFSMRPVRAGDVHALTVHYGDDELFAAVDVAVGEVEVWAAATSLEMEVTDVAYSGSWVRAHISVASDDSAVYGHPDGTVVIEHDGVEVATYGVRGTVFDDSERLAPVEQDLTDPDADTMIVAMVPVPELLLGSADTMEISAAFIPSDSFTEAGTDPLSVPIVAPATQTDLFVGGSGGQPADVTGSIDLVSQVTVLDGTDSLAAAGTVAFFVNGTEIGRTSELTDSAATVQWDPQASGEYTLTAEFVAATPGQLSSVSAPLVVTVDLPSGSGVLPDELARTGSESVTPGLLSAGVLLFAGLGVLLIARRRSHFESRRT